MTSRASNGRFASWQHRSLALVEADRAVLTLRIRHLREAGWSIQSVAEQLKIPTDVVFGILSDGLDGWTGLRHRSFW